MSRVVANYLTAVCGLLMGLLLCVTPGRAETLVSSSSGDKVSAQLTAMLNDLNLVPTDRLTGTVRQLRFLEREYEVNPFLLVAICERETQWPMAAKGHAFAHNTKSGMLNFTATVSLPAPFNDLDTCALGLKLQKDRYGSDSNAVIAAYFAGPTQVDDWEGKYPAEIKELLNNIWAMVSTYEGPVKAAKIGGARADKPTVAETGRGAFPSRSSNVTRPQMKANGYSDAVRNSYRTNQVPPTEVEQAYIDTMRYFNRRINEDVAKQIYYSIAKYAAEYEGTVDARLVMALVATESNFNPAAVSHAGAQGLGQLMPFTADSLNVADPFDIDQNIWGTYQYLDREFRRWGESNHMLDRVLAAYNAGPGAVSKYNGIPPYKETQNYVRRVVNIYTAILQPFEREAHIRGNTMYDTQLLDGYKH